MSKVIIKTVDGVEKATGIIEFDLGKLSRDEASEDGKHIKTTLTMNLLGMVKYYRQLVYEKAQSENFEEYNEALEQYVMLKINEIIGVESTPLIIDKDGNVKGLSKSTEVVYEVEADSWYQGRMKELKDSRTVDVGEGTHTSMETTAKYFEVKEDESK